MFFTRTLSFGLLPIMLVYFVACGSDDPKNYFQYGVSSGDPLTDRVMLWTHVSSDEAAVPVQWQVSDQADFSTLVVSGDAEARVENGHTVKIDVEQLAPNRHYYYRFLVGKTSSPVGRTRTLPTGRLDSVKFAVFSCANYPAGYFHVYHAAAEHQDLDAIIHLGDYIYEYGRFNADGKPAYASEQAEKMGRQVKPEGELLTLDDYRQRYKTYRSDPDLQKLHRDFPWIVIWDDHEVANDTWTGGAQNHNKGEGDFLERRANALKAYYEWLPIRELKDRPLHHAYRSFVFGDLVHLSVLETRLSGRDQQLDYSQFGDTSRKFDTKGFTQALSNPQRSLLGDDQRDWLQKELISSTAKWNVLGQQVLMGQMYLPAAMLQPNPFEPYLTMEEYMQMGELAQIAEILQKKTKGVSADKKAFFQANKAFFQEHLAYFKMSAMPYNLDAWDGYPVEREYVLRTALAAKKNLVVLSGDTHNAWANEVKTADGQIAAVEFAGAGVTSPGIEKYLGLAEKVEENPNIVAQTEGGLTRLIDGLKYANVFDRGFLLTTFTPERAQAQWIFVSDITKGDFKLLEQRNKGLFVEVGKVNEGLKTAQ